jgi:hypothetical protein
MPDYGTTHGGLTLSFDSENDQTDEEFDSDTETLGKLLDEVIQIIRVELRKRGLDHVKMGVG